MHYENIISDPENQIRSLIEACGLEWETACLDFYKEKRAINTASLWQARQPIYQASKKRWHNYAEQLAPLAKKISKYLEPEDIDEYKKRGIKLKSWLTILS